MTAGTADKERIKEVIIVEGRNDTAAVKRAFDADTIETRGFGIRKETWELMEKAYNDRGIVIFTDPDHAGNEIKTRITARFPGAGQAFLSRSDAASGDDIGIENASVEAIRGALAGAKVSMREKIETFSHRDLQDAGLMGGFGAKERRDKLGKILGIGYGSGKSFLLKLNGYGITREVFEKALNRMRGDSKNDGRGTSLTQESCENEK